MTELVLPDFELEDPFGNVIMRTGLVVTFFLRSEHRAHAAAVQSAVTAFVQRFMGGSTLFAVDAHGEFTELTGNGFAESMREKFEPAARETQLHITDSPIEAPYLSARYCGLERQKLESMNWPNAVCGLAFCFSIGALEGDGLSHIQEFGEKVVASLPFASGYVAPAFVYRDGVGADQAFATMRRLCARYRCFDIPALLPDCFEVGGGPKGIYWGNYWGRELVDELGGEHVIRRRLLASPEIRIRPIGLGALNVYLGALPIAGDSNRKEDVDNYRSAFRLLEPALRPRTMPYLEFDEPAMSDWLTRFATA